MFNENIIIIIIINIILVIQADASFCLQEMYCLGTLNYLPMANL